MGLPYTIYGADGDQFVTFSAQRNLPLGTRMVLPDGRVFRYCQNAGTAIQAGLLLRAADVLDSVNTAHQLAADAAAGATSLQINSSVATGPATINTLDEGFIAFSATGATGQGEIHRIYKIGSTNDAGDINSPSESYAWTTATGVVMTVHLYPDDSLQNAWTTETGSARVIISKYRDVAPTDISIGSGGAVVGVSNAHVAANYFFWAQTWGPCAVEFSTSSAATHVIGMPIMASTGANSTGNVAVALSTQSLTPTATSDGGWGNPQIGTIIAPASATTFMAIVDLNIAP